MFISGVFGVNIVFDSWVNQYTSGTNKIGKDLISFAFTEELLPKQLV